ncbi:MAG TPA: hypothetical protein VGE58_06025 [Daejeonella sp.]
MNQLAKYAIASMMIILASCGKKDWTCTCNTASGGKSTYNINNAKKKLAKERCKEYQSTGDNCSL